MMHGTKSGSGEFLRRHLLLHYKALGCVATQNQPCKQRTSKQMRGRGLDKKDKVLPG